MRIRFAPSPTGDLHLGGAWTALAAFRFARAHGGVTVLRMEDIDTARIVPGAATRIEEDLAWLGIDWDESPARGGTYASYTQSQRTHLYARALVTLSDLGLVYPCDCSRSEIQRVASAPHAGEECVYPGTCWEAARARTMKRPPALRLRVPPETRADFVDAVRGPIEQDIEKAVGDFVLCRSDGTYSYQLVVAVDDAAMRISHVVRADDLLMSTPRQRWLMSLMGTAPSDLPTYAHLPLVVSHDGQRLAKRAGSTSIRELRARGLSAKTITDTLGKALGIETGKEPPSAWRKEPWPIPKEWM
jgi:glutamyl-tRNA synthetase